MSDEPVDIKPQLDEECIATEKCQKKVHEYEQCLERIKTVDPLKEPHCWGQYFEVVHCVDVCVHPKLWPTLK